MENKFQHHNIKQEEIKPDYIQYDYMRPYDYPKYQYMIQPAELYQTFIPYNPDQYMTYPPYVTITNLSLI
jgi:hypothetical protein